LLYRKLPGVSKARKLPVTAQADDHGRLVRDLLFFFVNLAYQLTYAHEECRLLEEAC